jgi:hypothetical protein
MPSPGATIPPGAGPTGLWAVAGSVGRTFGGGGWASRGWGARLFLHPVPQRHLLVRRKDLFEPPPAVAQYLSQGVAAVFGRQGVDVAELAAQIVQQRVDLGALVGR